MTEVSLTKYERTQKSVHTIPSDDTKMIKRFKRKIEASFVRSRYKIVERGVYVLRIKNQNAN